MKKILKIGDYTYAQSLQHFSQSYLTGFPQREQFLFQHVRKVEFVFFRHKILNNLEDVYEERQRIKNYLQNHHFNFLMIDNPLSSLLITADCTVPILFDSIDWYSEMYLREFGIDKRYYLLHYGLLQLLQMAERVISQSPLNLNALQKWGLKTKKTVVIPNGYDARYFYPYSDLRINRLKKYFSGKYNIDLNKRKIIVYTGKLGKWYKNIKVIVNAIEDNQVFFIVGDGPLLKEIPGRKNLIKCGRVDFKKVPDYTNIADVLVFPVDKDCSPLAVSEYCAVGKPIVIGKGRIEWLLNNSQNSCLVNNNVSSWRIGIKKALEMKQINKNCSLNIAKKLSWQILAKKFTDFINLA